MAIALVIDGQVKEQRDMALQDVPAHKRDMWRPIEGERPTYDAATHTCTGPVYQIEANRVLRVWTVTARDLAAVKAEAKARVNEGAGLQRLQYITDAPGQDLVYDRKRREAHEVNILGGAANPDATKYPLLSASIGTEVPNTNNAEVDYAAAASLVISRELAWAQIAKTIESKRLTALKAIADATTVEAVAQAAAVEW